MAQPAWQAEPLALGTAPVPEYGSGSLADLLPSSAGQEVRLHRSHPRAGPGRPDCAS
ncbi:alkaline phosphatase family protein [Streptomyces californicus]